MWFQGTCRSPCNLSIMPPGLQPVTMNILVILRTRKVAGKNIGVGCHALLLDIFMTQWWNPGPRHCTLIIYWLSPHGNPRTLEWVAYPFSGASSQSRNQTAVSCIAGRFFTSWATRKAPLCSYCSFKWSDLPVVWNFTCYLMPHPPKASYTVLSGNGWHSKNG